MFDSTAWKPLLLLPLLIVAIIIERGKVSLVEMVTGVPLWLVFVLGVFALFRFIRREPGRDYQRPKAEAKNIGVIDVRGDVEELQQNFNQLTTPSTWTHVSDRHWRVDMPSIGSMEQTREVAKDINHER